MKSPDSSIYDGRQSVDNSDEEFSRLVLSLFRVKEEEIEKKKMEVKERVQTQLGRAKDETKRVTEIPEEIEALQDPMRKEVAFIRKRIDTVNKELRPLGLACQKRDLRLSRNLPLMCEISLHLPKQSRFL